MEAGLAHRTVLRHRQVIAAAMAARSRPVSLHWLSAGLFLGLAAAVWAGHAVTFWFVQQLPFAWMFAIGTYLPTLIPATFAFVVVAVVGTFQNRAVARAYLSNFERLGIPEEIEALYEILPDGLRLSTDRITIFPRWHAVDTVERGADGWVVSADHLTFLVPRDSFADETAERVFVAALVDHLSDEARHRSNATVAFASEVGAPTGDRPEDERPAPPSASPPAVRASAQVTAQEMSWAGRVGFDRIARTGWHTLLYPMVAAVVGGLVGMMASGVLLVVVPLSVTLGNVMAFAALSFVLPLIGGGVGLWLGHRRLGTVLYKAYHAALAQRGSPPAAECEWRLGEDGLVSGSTRGHATTRWDAISEVFRADGYWIVLADLSANVIPRRAFADETAERAFIGGMVARLPQLARERSRAAAEFAAG
jgi:hypothetical protein